VTKVTVALGAFWADNENVRALPAGGLTQEVWRKTYILVSFSPADFASAKLRYRTSMCDRCRGGLEVEMDSIISVLRDNLPWVWVAVTIICIVIESLTLSLTTIWFGISAFLMVFLAFTPMPFVAQLFIFVAIALLLLIFTRPVVKQKLNQKKIATNYERVIGQIAVVTKKITALEKGSVKINGMEWTAAVKEDITLEEGSKCIVEEIAGVTAYVKSI
jgi:membrane protein implicated in regulation of membrane protease activity